MIISIILGVLGLLVIGLFVYFIILIKKNKLNAGVTILTLFLMMCYGGLLASAYSMGYDVWTYENGSLVETDKDYEAKVSNLKDKNNIFWLFEVNSDIEKL